MPKILQVIIFFFAISPILHAENWVFVASRENQCNIKVYYDQAAVKDKKLIEKWDVSEATDCESTKNKDYLFFESNLDCDKKQLTPIIQKTYFKDGKKAQSKSKYPTAYEPFGTPKLLLDAACLTDKE